jgi:hypothetical protein
MIQFAVGPVVREDTIEVPDAIESGPECSVGGLLARRVNRDPDERAHVRLDRFIAMQIGPRTRKRRDHEAQSNQPAQHSPHFVC